MKTTVSVTGHSQCDVRNPWFVVVAGGQGSRLLKLTAANHGHPVPKQFAFLNGVHSMLQTTVRRVLWLTTSEPVLVVCFPRGKALTKYRKLRTISSSLRSLLKDGNAG